MDKYKAEIEKLKGQLSRFQSMFVRYYEDMKTNKPIIDDLDLNHYLYSDDYCLEYHNQYIRSMFEVQRKLDIVRQTMREKCLDTIPQHLRPFSEFIWVISSEDQFRALSKYVECSRPYYEKTLILLHEELKLSTEIIRKSQELLKNR